MQMVSFLVEPVRELPEIDILSSSESEDVESWNKILHEENNGENLHV